MGQRGGMEAATANRDEASVNAILRWAQRAFHTDARSVMLVATLLRALLAQNPAVQHPGKEVSQALQRVLDCVQQELAIQRACGDERHARSLRRVKLRPQA